MKKTKRLSSILLKEFRQNEKAYLMIGIILILGFLLGIITVIITDIAPQLKEYLNRFLSAYPLQGASELEIFKISLLNYLQVAFWVWISGWYIWLFPIGLIQVIVKGFRIGFTLSSLINCYGAKGIILSVLSVLPSNLVFIPTFCFFSVYQLKFLGDRHYILKNNINSSARRQIYGKNIFMALLFLLLLIICALVEGFVIPNILSPFCDFFIN